MAKTTKTKTAKIRSADKRLAFFREITSEQFAIERNKLEALREIAVATKRMADHIEQIKNGMRFICERWKS